MMLTLVLHNDPIFSAEIFVLVSDPQLMHAPVNCLDRFPEGPLEISEMVFFSVVVSDRSGGSVRGRVPHIF